MCGIVGYIGKKEALPFLIRALHKLEYRGYDSAGVAILGTELNIYKNSGRVESLEKKTPPLNGFIGIGHTRWATHGEPSQVNAHPHIDCNGNVAVVHNGVITNYQQIKEELMAEGHRFVSETDTEIIPHLIEKYFKGDLEAAVAESLKHIKGSYAVAIIAKSEDKIIVAKNGNPLVIGLGSQENIIASDIPPLLEYTNQVIYLEDGETGVITQEKVKIKKLGREILKPISTIDWSAEDVQNCGYEHMMLKEIHEQPKVIRQALANYDRSSKPIIGMDFMSSRDGKGLLILACGTSYHAGLVAKYIAEELLDIPVRVELASEVNHRQRVIPIANAIAITQSGETADVLISMKKLMDAGCLTLAITNVKGSSASRLANQTLYTQAGPELSVAATKSFIAELVELYKLILLQPAADEELRQKLISELRLIPSYVQWVLDNESQISDCAKRISTYSNVFYIGRGINYPIALEGALKIKEISYIFAEAYAAGEIKHGPFSLLQKDTPVIAIISKDFTYEAMITNIKEIKARKAPVIAIAPEGEHNNVEKLVDIVIDVPDMPNLFSPIGNAVTVQLLAYYVAKYRGCPIDFPRNLAKSVTVE